jgi:hypothetical protein
MSQFKASSLLLCGGIKENHGKPQSRWSVSGLGFETETFTVLSRNASHTTTTFRNIDYKSTYLLGTWDNCLCIKYIFLILYGGSSTSKAAVHQYWFWMLQTYKGLCEISSSHGGEYDVQNCLLGCTAAYNNCRPTFQRCVLPPDDGGSTYLWNVGRQLFYTAVHPRRQFWTYKGLALNWIDQLLRFAGSVNLLGVNTSTIK